MFGFLKILLNICLCFYCLLRADKILVTYYVTTIWESKVYLHVAKGLNYTSQ